MTNTAETKREATFTRLRFWLPLVCSLSILGIQVHHYWPFMADDAFISLRYSERLMTGKGLTWTDGQRVEGYTNLLWVLICAGLGKLHLDLVFAARLLGLTSTLGALAALAMFSKEEIAPERWPWAAACGVIPFALCAPFAVWAIGGLEQPLVICLLGGALLSLTRYLRRPRSGDLFCAGLWLSVLTLARADGLLLVLLLTAGIFVTSDYERRSSKTLTLMAGPSCLAFAVQLTFRRWFYKEWVPNTALVKVSFTAHRLQAGVHYVAKNLGSELPLVLLACVGTAWLWRQPAKRSLAMLYAIVVCGDTAYILFVGGDFFPASRPLLPVLYVLCFAAVSASNFIYDARGNNRAGWAVVLTAVIFCVASSRRVGQMAEKECWEWEYKELGTYLREHARPDALLVSNAAGVVPYYSKLPSIDPLGLCDRHIAHHPSRLRGVGPLGHELGDGKYVLDQHPDLMFFFAGGPTGLQSDQEIISDPRFIHDYEERRIYFQKPYAWSAKVYVRKNSPAVTAIAR